MTVARRRIVDVAITRYYHCISRCVRDVRLSSSAGDTHRKAWIEARLEHLSKQFALSVCGFAIMDSHLHILFRLDPAIAGDWSAEAVIRRWMAVYPPRRLDRKDSTAVQAWVARQCQDAPRVARYRERLQSLGWFMKALKEPLARLANKEDSTRGPFWEARYKSIAILDEAALLAVCAYIDLNPLAAGLATMPEASAHTSVKQRVDHVRTSGAIQTIRRAAEAGSVAAAEIEGDCEQAHWLCPFQNRRQQHAGREGMLSGFSLASYLELVDWTARLWRTGKATLSQAVADIMDRLGSSVDCWRDHMHALRAKTEWCGTVSAMHPSRLQEIARLRGAHHIENALVAVPVG